MSFPVKIKSVATWRNCAKKILGRVASDGAGILSLPLLSGWGAGVRGARVAGEQKGWWLNVPKLNLVVLSEHIQKRTRGVPRNTNTSNEQKVGFEVNFFALGYS